MTGKKQKTLEEKIEQVKNFRPIDDTFFEVLADDIGVCQEMLRIILEDEKLIVKDVIVQSSERNLYGRSVRLDALCILGNGKKCNVEVQRSNKDHHLKRVRFNASVITVRDSQTDDKFEETIDLIVVYISEFDIFKRGRVIYHVDSVIRETQEKVDDGLERAVDNGVKNLVVQPTHLMHGAEYDELVEAIEKYQDKFETVRIAEPLLGEVGSDATVINEDKAAVAEAITAEAVKLAGYDSMDAAAEDGTAFVFMGHGTSHTANVTYDQMQTQLEKLNYKNAFVGTVEGEPEDTACEAVIEKVKEAGYKKVILRPLMVVAGDHANNDMAGDDEDSWKSQFEASKAFDSVDTQIEGLGRIKAVQDIYVAHTKAALEAEPLATAGGSNSSAALEDGTYTVDFNTDSTMFHVNEAKEGKAELTVKDGKMTAHITLPSKNIVNLFVGTAADAQKDGAKLLEPTTDTVEYSDGTSEEVYGFDVPVPAVDEDFDLALIGTKGKWYDHKVSVSNPEKKN